MYKAVRKRVLIAFLYIGIKDVVLTKILSIDTIDIVPLFKGYTMDSKKCGVLRNL